MGLNWLKIYFESAPLSGWHKKCELWHTSEWSVYFKETVYIGFEEVVEYTAQMANDYIEDQRSVTGWG